MAPPAGRRFRRIAAVRPAVESPPEPPCTSGPRHTWRADRATGPAAVRCDTRGCGWTPEDGFTSRKQAKLTELAGKVQHAVGADELNKAFPGVLRGGAGMGLIRKVH